MEEEPMALSTRDRDRLKVLSEAKKGLITQKQAADQLKLTERHRPCHPQVFMAGPPPHDSEPPVS